MNVMQSPPADGKSVMRSRRNRPALVILVVAFLAIVLFVIWSLWAELDQISRARGQVIPSGRVQVMQSSDGGVISRIAGNEGDHVRRGQMLGAIGATGRATGPHLHWGMKWKDTRIDPLLLVGPMPE